MVDLVNGISWSCNCYFNQMGMRVGDEALFRALGSAGIGKNTGIELAEVRGVMPSRELKMRLHGSRWNAYDTALVSMGQGLVTVTPLQAALFAAAFCNGGTLWKPHLTLKVIDPNGTTVWERRREENGRLLLTGKKLAPIIEGMFEVVNTGSGRNGAVPGLKICGKTGSAEVGPRSSRRLIVWFIAFTEYRGRRYAIAVMVEDGISGGSDCAPLAAEFFREYLHPAEEM
jgi:cell division protein FtsI/penicillin-binding protein 2